MGNNRRFSIKFGGIDNKNSQIYDTRMKINYFNVFSTIAADNLSIGNWKGGKVDSYADIFPSYTSVQGASKASPTIVNYTQDNNLVVKQNQGITAIVQGEGGQNYSIYRREYEVYTRPGLKIEGFYYNEKFYQDEAHDKVIYPRNNVLYIDKLTGYCYQYDSTTFRYYLTDKVKVYMGEWEPAFIQGYLNSLYDLNVTSGHSYQYIMYPAESFTDKDDDSVDEPAQVFANSSEGYQIWIPDDKYVGQGKLVPGGKDTSGKYGSPVSVKWDEWSIAELEPIEFDERVSIVKDAYKVNLDQIWLFKYSLETGAQTQNISRSEFQTLDRFIKVGYGESNYVSGEVSALLGSEIIPYSKNGYIERLQKSRLTPLSTNEKVKMLERWREFVNSKNPKLLKDAKGQSWIVQIMSSTNSPKNFYSNQPDTISFQWKQIGETKNVVIYADTENITQECNASGSMEWEPMFRNKKF